MKDGPAVPPIVRKFWPVVLLAIVALIPVYKAVFGGEAIGPFDQLHWTAPWNIKPSDAPFDVLQADGVLQFYVWRDLVFEAWGKGQLPFWNHYQLAGYPLLGNSQSAGFYPPHVLMGLLHVGTPMAMALLAWFHLFWAGLGAYFLSRRLGANKLGAWVAGSSFALSSFLVSWTGLPSVIETVSWIPWILGLILAVFDPPARKPWIALAVCTGMMLLAGHLQFAAYGFLASAVLLIWLVWTRRAAGGTKSGIAVVLAAVVGVGFAAPQLLPVLSYSQFSHRRNVPTDDGYQAFIGGAIQPYELIKVVAPSIQGNPRESFVQDDKIQPVSTYYPAIVKPGANFAESAVGLGCLVVILLCAVPMVLRRREPLGAVLTVGLIGLLIALGTPINRLFYFFVPGFSSTGSPGRAICLFVLAGCVSAGLALSRLDELKTSPQKIKISGGIFAAIVLIFFALSSSSPVAPGKISPALIDAIKSQALSSALGPTVGIALLAALAIYLLGKEGSDRAKALMAAVPILSGIAFLDAVLVPTGTPMPRIENASGNQRIAPINSGWDLLQLAHTTLIPNLSAYNRIHSIDGYDSLMHRDTVALLKDIDGQDAAPPANGNMQFVKPGADMKKLADAGVTEVWASKPVAGLANGVQDSSGLYKYKLDGPGRASTPAGPAAIESESFAQMKIRAQGPGKLVVRERNMPGWVAKIDGSHTAIGGTTWMEMDLAAGSHEIELNYVPPGFITGVFFAIGAFLLAVLLGFTPVLFGKGSK